MAVGYLVTLGNGSLDPNDAISASQSTFTSSSTLGAGSWTWSGVWDGDGQFYSNIQDTGTYFLGSDDNVYFVPTNWYTTSGSATVTTAPTYLAADGIVDGTSGADAMSLGYSDTTGDSITNDNDTIQSGDGNDTVSADFGNDSVSGGTGDDVIYGDTIAAPVTGAATSFSWASQGITDEANVANGLTGLSANGDVRVTLSVQREANFGSATMETNDPLYNYNAASDTSSITLFGGNEATGGTIANNQNAATATIDFSSGAAGYSDEVSNVTFGIFDLDELPGQFIDQVIVTAYDANGNPIPVTVTLGSTTTLTSTTNANGSQTVTSVGYSGGLGATDSQTGYASFSVAGPVSYITIDYNNIDPAYGAHAIRIGDLQFTSLPATGGNDTLNGDAGNDTLFGQDGNDTLDGGTGNDTLYGGLGNDIMQGGADSDSMFGDDGNDTIGDSGTTSDYIEGGAGNDYITSGAGADTVYGGTGADSLFGNDGNDTLYGDDGDDYVDGDGGSDKLYGGIGNDVIVGDDGNDSMYGGTGNDQIYASSGENYAEGGDGNDSIYMGTGNDTIYGGLNEDVIYGGAGNDLISGDAGNDTLFGDAGNDTLTGGAGNDSITGGLGSDRIILGNTFGTDTIDGSEDAGNTDVDVLDGSAMSTDTTVNMSGPEAGTLTSGTNTATFSNIEAIVTGSGADSIIGSSGNDTITTGAGADRVNMGAGNDTINLGAGTATDGVADVVVLQDGSGNDTINGFDAPTANGDGTFTGVDKLDVSALYDLPAGDPLRTPVRTNDVVVTDDGAGNAVLTFPNGESVTLIGVSPTTANNPFYLNAIGIPMGDGTVEGSAGDDLINGTYMGDPDGDRVDANDALLAGDVGNDDLIYGFGGNDTIVANLGNDEVYGGTGNDSISGGAGFDTIFGDDGNDTINGGDDNDMIFGGIDDDKIEGDLGDDMLLGEVGNDSMAGGAGNDHLVGGDGNDLMNGGADNDLMYGGFNNDTLSGDAGTDTLYGDQGDDLLYGGAGNDTLFGGDDNDVLDGGDNNDYVNGGNGNDTLYGGLGNDSLVGGAGNDTLYAGGGDDGLVGSSGDDTFAITNGWGNDTIAGSETLETNGDTLDLSAVTTNLTVNLTSANNESGSFTDGLGNAATFVEIENIILGGGNDTIVLNDTTGDYTVQQFQAPTPNGDGTFTGVDVLNVTGLHDAQNNPVNVNDVVVTDDGSGNAVLNFPNGQSLTLVGISPTEADNPLYLNAIGIPLSDGTVSGTTGDDVINASYTGDPDGDIVDDSDAILAGHAGNDDLIEAGSGNDTINSGAGNDTIYAGADNDTVHAGIGNDTIFGEAGNDWLVGEAGDDLIYGGDGDDLLFGFENNDTLDGGTGNDIINGGEGADVLAGGEGADRFVLEANFGNDTIAGGETGLDNDTIWSTQGVDTVTTFTGNEAGTITEGSSTATFSEIEVLTLGGGNDLVDASAANSAVTVYGGAGSDVVTGSSAADVIYGGDAGDTITGGAGADSIYGGNGDDWLILEDGFGNDTIVGGEGSELSGDYILGENLTGDVTLDLTAGSASNAEDGTLTMGGETVTFSEIEVVILGSGNDTVIGSSGNEMIATGGGADTVNGGAGDDIFDIGTSDGASDLIILQDDFGNDTIYSFEAPTPNGDGTFTGTDMLDVTALYDKPASDPTRTPVYTNDVTVTDDGMGNAVLSFPNGESLTLVGISPIDAANPFFLNAIGIPMPDGTVAGTAGDDVIDATYTGDLDGDKVDSNDAILAGDTANDDLIYGYDGNDSIFAGDGNDEVYGGTGSDSIVVGDNDGADIIAGGEDASGLDNDILDLDDQSTTGGANVVLTGNEAGTYDFNNAAATGSFSEIESFDLTDSADTFDGSAATSNTTVLAGAGNDTITSGSGDDSILAGAGDDLIDGGAGDDSIDGGTGNDTFALNENSGIDTIVGGENAGDTDTLSFQSSTIGAGATVTFTGDESGTYLVDGSSIAGSSASGNFSEIEQIVGTDSSDLVDASASSLAVTIYGEDGFDILTGSSAADVIYGGDGGDLLTGGAGADVLNGDAGNDVITFSEGDTVEGGTGDDTFIAENLGETSNGTITITGGSDTETTFGDTLQLGSLADMSSLVKISDGINASGNETFHGSVTMDDGTILNFSEIENIICFTPGTRIATPKGARDIATLRVGDLVVTRDHGLQPIRWIQQRTVPAIENFAPIRIRPGVVVGQQHDLLVSPQHRMLFQGYRAELLFGESEVLVSAKHLVDGHLVTREAGGNVTYIHMMFDEHEVVYAEGAATESFHPGDVGLTAISDPAREELFALFPELRTNVNGYGQTARRCLKMHEIGLLVR